jgi:hypothetical protein
MYQSIFQNSYLFCFILWPCLNPPKPWGFSMNFWYNWKALNKVVCMLSTSQILDQYNKGCWIWNDFFHWKLIKISNYFCQPINVRLSYWPFLAFYIPNFNTWANDTWVHTLTSKGLCFTHWPITLEPFQPINAFSSHWPFNLPFHMTKGMGNFSFQSHPIFLFIQKWFFHNWVFWKVVSLRHLKRLLRKLYPLQLWRWLHLGQWHQGPLVIY